MRIIIVARRPVSPLRGRIHLRRLTLRPPTHLLQSGGGPYILNKAHLTSDPGAGIAGVITGEMMILQRVSSPVLRESEAPEEPETRVFRLLESEARFSPFAEGPQRRQASPSPR